MTEDQDDRSTFAARPGRPSLGLAIGVGSFTMLALAAWAITPLSLDRPAASPGSRDSEVRMGMRPSPPDEVRENERLQPETALAVVLRAHPELLPRNGSPFRYQARTVLEIDDRAVLIAAASSDDALPTVTGSLGIFYLRSGRTDHRVVGFWPSLTIGASMGRAPGFRVSDEFGRWPVLVVSIREVRAGVACELTQLVELAPSGPAASDAFVSAYDARGADGPSGHFWAGRIRDVVPDGGFTLAIGARSVRFVKTDGRYLPAPGLEAPHCGVP